MSVAKLFKEELEAFLMQPEKYLSNLSEEVQKEIRTRFLERVGEAFDKQFANAYTGKHPVMSNLGKCVRMLAYQYHDFPAVSPEAKAKLKFLIGDLTEAAIYAIAEMANVQLTRIQDTVTYQGIRGKIDGFVGSKALFDVKTTSRASFDIARRKGGVGDDFGYLTQINLYWAATEAEEAFFLYVCPDTGEIEIWPAVKAPDLVDLAQAKKQMVENSTPDRLPARPYTATQDKKSGKLCLALQCKFCPYRYVCWNISGIGEGYNKSEVYYVDNENPYGPSPGFSDKPISAPSPGGRHNTKEANTISTTSNNE